MKKELQDVLLETRKRNLQDHLNTPMGKITLNKTAYYLRQLPQERRQKLVDFIKEKRDGNLFLITTEMFEYLTGSLSPNYQRIDDIDIGFDLCPPELRHYPVDEPYAYKTADCKTKENLFGTKFIASKASQSFYNSLKQGAELFWAMTPEQFDDFAQKVTAPDTFAERTAKNMRRLSFDVKARVHHIVAWGHYLMNKRHFEGLTK